MINSENSELKQIERGNIPHIFLKKGVFKCSVCLPSPYDKSDA